ncbi:MAG: prepilin-type N-terminal cleavage/methylation domain-containing protein, partial [Elusimicrobia bacterium]|nr:prepilin-type N-terminal cleavage/methylation domain-containing protein [Elusimicrobiota bacterium]
MKKNNKGFSLMEVILVVVIIAVLSAISGPIYKGYSTKAKQSEGYALLGVILSAQQSYYENYSKNYLANYNCGNGGDPYNASSKSS